jgi:hypothetical protein
MKAGRIRFARCLTGAVVLMALTGILATCGGPMAYATEDAEGGRDLPGFTLALPGRLRVSNPEAASVWLPVRVAGRRTAELAGVEIIDDENPARGEVVGRSLRPSRLLADPTQHGWFYTVVQVPIDLKALDLKDGESRKVRVKALVDEGAGGPAGAERATLAAQATIAVSALPSPGGDWYPGDAHFHSTVSDGALTLSETLTEAKNVYGMKWLVVTDHWAGSGGGGVSKFAAAGGAPGGFPSYYDTVMKYGVQLGLPIGPACEWSSVKTSMPGSGSHVLGFGMSRSENKTFPAMFTESRQSLVDKLNAHNSEAFTIAAHPVGTQTNDMYVWEWSTVRNDGLELFTDMRAFDQTIRTNWFTRLRSELATVVAKGPYGNFTVGIATSDGHANGWTTVAGGASMTWVWLPSGERTLASPANVTALWKRLRAGNCVASGQGDFAKPTITASAGGVSAKAGPGDLAKCSVGSSVSLDVAYASRTGHRLKSIDVWRGNADGIVKSGTYAVDAISGTKTIPLGAVPKHCFYVVVAHFYDPISLNTAGRDVVANPVWMKVQ